MVPMESRTKIVATLGPASESAEVLDRLLVAGVDVVRLNLSHGSIDEHVRRLHDVRAAAERVGAVVAVLAASSERTPGRVTAERKTKSRSFDSP